MSFLIKNCILCKSEKLEQFMDDVKDFEYSIEGTFPIVRCKDCGLIMQKNIPSYKDLMNFYPDDYMSYAPFRKMGFVFSIFKNRFYVKQAKEIKKLVGSSGRVLDIGCANCTLLNTLKKYGNYELYSIDIKKLDIDYGDIRFTEGNIENTDFKKNYFDIIVMENLVEHTPNPLMFMKKVHKILRKDGWVIGKTPNINSFDASLFGKYWGGYHIPRHLYFFNHFTLQKLLKKAGFLDINFPINYNPSNWCISVQNLIRKKRKRNIYKKGWYIPYIGIILLPVSLISSLFKKNSVMDFRARKKGVL